MTSKSINISILFSISSAIEFKYLALISIGVLDQIGNAFSAASTASFMSVKIKNQKTRKIRNLWKRMKLPFSSPE